MGVGFTRWTNALADAQNAALSAAAKQNMQQSIANAYGTGALGGFTGLDQASQILIPQTSQHSMRLSELYSSIQQKVADKAAEHFSAVAAPRVQDPDSNMAWLDRRVNEMRVAL